MSMGLYAMPKYKDCDAGMVYAVEEYLDAVRFGYEGSILDWVKNEMVLVVLNDEGDICSDEELNDCFTPEMVEFYKGHYKAMYWPWDTDKKFVRYRIVEEVASWENAYQIAYWFENNVELVDGWCCPDMTDLQKLYDTCRMVVVENRELAPKLLPIPDEDAVYDEDYFDVVYATMHKVHKLMNSVDFDKYTIHFDCD